jgi:hypothetical protein
VNKQFEVKDAFYKRVKALGYLSIQAMVVALFLYAPLLHAAEFPSISGLGHFKLQDTLDRPQDGYCLDIVGSGPYIRFDLPMTAHNCKPGLYQDEAVTIINNSRISFPNYGVCATVAGLNGRALPGAAVVPRECDEQSPFMNATALQKFIFHSDGLVELAGSGLCLTVSKESDSTFEKTHRWRSLFVAKCDLVSPALSRWRFSSYQQGK